MDLFIDIETYSEKNIRKCGVHAYIEHESFEILLFSYAVGLGQIRCIDLASGEKIPFTVQKALYDPAVKKHAHNAAFERLCLSKYFQEEIPIEQWNCSMIKVAYCGLPLGLAASNKALDVEHKKLSQGTLLIKYFSEPCKPTKVNGMRMRNLPIHDQARWKKYKEYNIQDVEAERDNVLACGEIEIPQIEKDLYILDQKINDIGIKCDINLATNAANIDREYKNALKEKAESILNINPNSLSQIKDRLGDDTISLLKKDVERMIAETSDPEIKFLLESRLILSRNSTKKYIAMIEGACQDNRLRGLFQFYGANSTGRWAGRQVQMQNLPQNHLPDIEVARRLIADNNPIGVEILYGDVIDTLSQLVRTAFIPEDQNIFMIADFSAIEARVTAWLAEEQWRMDVFNTHGKIYEASASKMFSVPIEEITKNSDLRKKGKVAELALGFGGGEAALERMGAGELGLKKQERLEIVKTWRSTSPNIVEMWEAFEDCAIRAVLFKEKVICKFRNIEFSYEVSGNNWWLRIKLPSGRSLMKYKPIIKNGKFGKTHALSYFSIDNTSTMCETDTYGGMLCENIVQGTARDILAYAMIRVDKAGYPIVLHVHDELVCEIPKESAEFSRKQILEIMGQPVSWAPELYCPAEGFLTSFYKKD
jgi:DNA polymerase